MSSDDIVRITVPDDITAGMRIDRFLAKQFPEYSRVFFQRKIINGEALYQGEACVPKQGVKPGDEIAVDFSLPSVYELKAQDIPLEVLYEDDDILVINKAPGVVVHPGNGNNEGTLVNALLSYCDNEDFEEMIDEDRRPGIVHRLDKDTSGALIIAKNYETREILKHDFMEHNVRKIYLAIILGEMPQRNGSIDLPIGRHPYNPMKRAVLADGGKEALTDYKTIASANGTSLMKVRIHTGRTHQIRVHFSHFGHPIIGDAVYGGRPRTAPYPATRQMLHAWKLMFKHPRTGLQLKIQAQLPEDFILALSSLGLPAPDADKNMYP